MLKIVVLLTLLAMAAPVVAQQGVNDPSIHGDPEEAAQGGRESAEGKDVRRGIAFFIVVLVVGAAAAYSMDDNHRLARQQLESQLSGADDTIRKLRTENQELREHLAVYGEQLPLLDLRSSKSSDVAFSNPKHEVIFTE